MTPAELHESCIWAWTEHWATITNKNQNRCHQLSKATILTRTGCRQSQPEAMTHWCAQELPLRGDLTEELRKFLHRDADLAGEHKRRGKEQPRLCQVTVPASINVVRCGSSTQYPQADLRTRQGEEEPDQTAIPASSHLDQDSNQARLG